MISKSIPLSEAVGKIAAVDNVLILIHQYPDGDTIGCGYALCRCLQQLGRRARVECNHAVDAKYEYITKIVQPMQFEPEYIISVDVADARLLGEGMAQYYERVNLSIDHHKSNTAFAEYSYVDPTAAAACEIIYDIISRISKVDYDMAAALYTGISTDTGCFKFSNTTPRTHEIAAQLMRIGIDYAEINRVMFDTKTKARVLVERMALESIEFSHSDRCAVICISTEMRDQTGAGEEELDGITALPRQIEGVLVGITVRERELGHCKVSVRTYPPISAAKLCRRFGGGGHDAAAGCEINDTLEAAKRLMQQAADAELIEAGL